MAFEDIEDTEMEPTRSKQAGMWDFRMWQDGKPSLHSAMAAKIEQPCCANGARSTCHLAHFEGIPVSHVAWESPHDAPCPWRTCRAYWDLMITLHERGHGGQGLCDEGPQAEGIY